MSPKQLSQPQLQLQEEVSHKRLWKEMKKMTCFPYGPYSTDCKESGDANRLYNVM